jgi:hypothetical protein
MRDLFLQLHPQVSTAVDKIALGLYTIADSDSDEGDEIHEDEAGEDWRHTSRSDSLEVMSSHIAKAIEVHNILPSGLGSGAESLPHKLGALLHAIGLECENMHQLSTYLARVFATCTDMGTEFGLADSIQHSVGQWCPEPRNLYSYRCPGIPIGGHSPQ